MSYFMKSLLSFILITIQYVFTSMIYPSLELKFAHMQADTATKAFYWLQSLQFVYSYSWILLLFIGYLIWRKDIKQKFFPKRTL